MSGRSVFAMILAAGQSRRMGRSKQLLPYEDGTIIEAVIAHVLESSIDGLVVVANPEVEEFLRGYLPEKCFISINDAPDSEMLGSAKIGLRALRQEFAPAAADGIMVLLGDQPQLTGGTITTCAEAFRLPKRAPGILVATYKKRRGHPTIFSMELLEAIEEWPDERKLSELLEENADLVRDLPITAQAMPIDVDTPEDYDKLVPP
jgi:molybdenum cofactor cytidylyltransferase